MTKRSHSYALVLPLIVSVVLAFLPGCKLAEQGKLSFDDTEFFYKDSGVRVKFILNAAGDATACILRMGNAEVSGTKIR